jgi:hypothetical protein
MKTRTWLDLLLVAALTLSTGWAQTQAKPLTNGDIIKMTKSGLGESTILAVIQATPANFDISPNALIALKTAGVTQNVINAVVAAAANSAGSGAPPATATPAPASSAGAGQPKATNQLAPAVSPPPAAQPGPSKEPLVVLLPESAAAGASAPDGGIPLPLEKAQLSQTKTKVSSLGGFAGDSVKGAAVQAGVSTAATEGEVHSSGMTGAVASSEAGGVLGSVVSRRKNSVTYIWALPGSSSPTQIPSNQPRFSVNFASWMYVSLNEFEPAIVKLTPTPPPSTWRLVAASQGKENAASSSAVDWQAFSDVVQDQAKSQIKKIAPGVFEISAAMPLEAGEYAIVLRPLSKTMKFSGADVARNQGNGKVLNSVWTFAVR